MNYTTPRHDAMKFLKWATRQKKFLAVSDRLRAFILARRDNKVIPQEM
jgi:hypothetical protein